MAELLTPADAIDRRRGVLRPARARRDRQSGACPRRSAGRRLRSHAVRRPRARLRRAEVVPVARRRDAVPRRAVLARAGTDRGGRRGRRCSASCERQPRRRSPRSTWPAPMPRTLGVIGCGRQAASHVAALRTALPSLERVLVHCRDARTARGVLPRARLRGGRLGPGGCGACDIVVTATTSEEPVLHGEWLRDGAFVCAVGANAPASRELDDDVLRRAAFVCTDSRAQAQVEAGDLIDPVATRRARLVSGARASGRRHRTSSGPSERRCDHVVQVERARGLGHRGCGARRRARGLATRRPGSLPRRRRRRRARARRRAGRGAAGSAPGEHRFVT